jgi:hypothetical protein
MLSYTATLDNAATLFFTQHIDCRCCDGLWFVPSSSAFGSVMIQR